MRLQVARWMAVASVVGMATAGVVSPTSAVEPTGGGNVSGFPAAGQGASLSAVDAISATDVWAVGEVNEMFAVAEHWDGKSWSKTSVPTPAGAVLTDVSASAPDDVWASGTNFTTGGFVLHWDGSSWNQVAVPHVENGGFGAVLALSKDNAWMASTGGGAGVVMHWNGRTWRVVRAPKILVGFTDIAADGPDDVWFVGVQGVRQGTVAEHWDGSSISLVKSANPDRVADALYGVAVTTGGDVWAVGIYGGNNGGAAAGAVSAGHVPAPHALTEHLDGGKLRWFQPAPRPNKRAWLKSVSAVSPSDIWAVGFQGPDVQLRGLVGHWDGQSWSGVRDGLSRNRQVQLYGVSAASADDVWAVGTIATRSGSSMRLLTLHWDGSTWSRVPV